jgi:hypothetical protein
VNALVGVDLIQKAPDSLVSVVKTSDYSVGNVMSVNHEIRSKALIPYPFSLRAKGKKLFLEVPLPKGEGFRVRAYELS